MGTVRTSVARWVVIGLAAVGVMSPVFGDILNSDCLLCHSDQTLFKTNSLGRAISLFVDESKLFWSVHSTNTCASCHSDVTANHPDDGVRPRPVECQRCHAQQSASYGASVHGLALKAGRADAATCTDCHGSHEVLPATSRSSRLHFSHQADTCGDCHYQESRDWALSVHGAALMAGVRDAPTCTDCHFEHKIEALSTEASRKISETVCSHCHASERINTRFNLPTDRVQTFFESYHGLASKYGSTLAANCGSCHGYHKVLPSSDPASSIRPDNLAATCGKCHPGASEKFAQSKIHVSLGTAKSGPDIGDQVNWWVRRVYLVLIVGVVGAMFVHNLLLFRRKLAAHLHSTDRPILRMNRGQRWQHAVLALSFIVLAITGFALKFPDSWLAKMLGSNEPLRRWMHRIAGVVLLLVGAYHIIYVLATKDGRKLVKDLFPIQKDLANAWGNARYLLGLNRNRPKTGRFGYAEKMEYWAVVWGTIIMGVTGLMIWFKMDVTQWLPRWLVDVALTIHYYEAILACLAIVVWHFYHVMFDPHVYPLNPSCWDGRVSEHWQQEEHPLDNPPRVAVTSIAAPDSPSTGTANAPPQTAAKEGPEREVHES